MFGYDKVKQQLLLAMDDRLKLQDAKLDNITNRLEKTINYVTGMTKGKTDEKFVSMKRELQQFIMGALEEKMVTIMSVLTKEKGDIKDIKEPPVKTIQSAPAVVSPEIMASFKALEKGLTDLSTEFRSYRSSKQKEFETVSARQIKLETDLQALADEQKKSRDLVEKFTLFFQKYEESKGMANAFDDPDIL